MRAIIKLASCIVACAVVLVLASVSLVHAQVLERVVEMRPEVNPPETIALRILEIKVAGNPVTFGQPFEADDEWLKSLSIRIKNISGKTINVLPITFAISGLSDGKQDLAFTILRGMYGNGYETRDASDERKPILADEEVDFTFTEKQLCIIRQIAAQKGITPSRLKLAPYTFLTLEDGSRLPSRFAYSK